MRTRILGITLAALLPLVGLAAERIPPAPKQFFNDYAGAVSPHVAAALNRKLEDFEKQTSSQILVAVYPKMESDSSIEDFTVRIAESWKVGRQGRDNGAVLFVFVADRKMFLQVGYGLEGALPDALASQIIEREIRPRFRNNDFNGGLQAGVEAILAATRGEYQGTGRAVSDARRRSDSKGKLIIYVIIAIFLITAASRRSRRGFWGRRRYHGWTFGGGGFGGGWGGGGGGSSSWGGGGFSGGGGRFGGGGAGGSW